MADEIKMPVMIEEPTIPEKPMSAEELTALAEKSTIAEEADQSMIAEDAGEKSPGGVPKKPKTEKTEKKFPSYEAEICDHLATSSEKLTFMEQRSMMQKALPHEIMTSLATGTKSVCRSRTGCGSWSARALLADQARSGGS